MITVRTSRMPHGSEFKRIHKAVEHLYYLVLFTAVPEYSGRSDTWESWLQVGTDLGVREAPKVVAPADRYVESIYSGAREVRITPRGNAQALERLDALVESPATIEARFQTASLPPRFQALLRQSVASLTVSDVVGISVAAVAGR
ncbi:MAG TPA: hypothetical protein VGQ42_11390 [Candidatus Dormibacteraeota bacterium]|jgi:hypothetical protein|nr:hypothetical protein [Candidatus Dormibacteraeota bacterium]